MKMIKIKPGIFSSQLGIFAIYMIASCLAIIGFRLIFPGEAAPLAHFSFSWRLTRGLLDFMSLFPALTLSSQIIPFGFKIQPKEKINRFSPQFLQSLRIPIITAIVSAALYGLIFFLFLPITQNHEANLRFQSRLYLLAKDMAEHHAEAEEWDEAAELVAICERIWPNSPELEHLRIEVEIEVMEELFVIDSHPDRRAEAASHPGEEEELNITEMLAMAETALTEERYFDAHWLATLSGRLADENSAERTIATRLAGRAWNGINSLAPNIRENEAYSNFRLKRDGHEAILEREWIRAYYIFMELRERSPYDPDVPRYLAMTEREVNRIAFFTDEMELTLGKILTGAVFSLPLANPTGQQSGVVSTERSSSIDSGRLVMRISSLSTFSDSAYGIGAELLAFDRNGQPLWSMVSPYVKILPITLESGPSLSVLLRSLDRADKTRQMDPEVTGQPPLGGAEAVLPISWNDFILLSNVRRGVSVLSPAELMTAAQNLGSCGYPPQIFEAELIRRFAEPLFLLTLGVIAIAVGWRYRALKRPRYMGIPMLGVLPLVLNGIVHFCRGWITELGTWAVVSLGFTIAALCLGIGLVILFVLSLILLAAQHS